MSQGGDSLQGELSDLIFGFVREFRLLEKEEISCYGLTVPQQSVVQELAKADTLTMNELSERMSVASSTMTRIVDNLVRDGIIERIGDDRDRRIVMVRLTDHGRELAKNVAVYIETCINTLLAQIPLEKQKEVLNAFKLLLDSLKKESRKCLRDCCK